jgi:hypothetical protein
MNQLNFKTKMGTQMNNILIQLILNGKIRSYEGLKSVYHKVIMKTHPDAVGSNIHLESYLQLSKDYVEARAYLTESVHGQMYAPQTEAKNYRLAFFQQLDLVESMEMPYAFRPDENLESLHLAKKATKDNLLHWKKELADLYEKADKEYAAIKKERPMGPYLKHAMALNMRPLMHNLIGYHLTGRKLYAKQAQQNLSGIIHRLSEKGCVALLEFIKFLLEDMKNGAAVLE